MIFCDLHPTILFKASKDRRKGHCLQFGILMLRVTDNHKRVTHTETNLQVSDAGLLKFVRAFFDRQISGKLKNHFQFSLLRRERVVWKYLWHIKNLAMD